MVCTPAIGSAASPLDRPFAEGEQVRVLVVEDHAGLARNIARALRDSAACAELTLRMAAALCP